MEKTNDNKFGYIYILFVVIIFVSSYLYNQSVLNTDYGRRVFVIGERINKGTAKTIYSVYYYKGTRYEIAGGGVPHGIKIGTKYYISFVEKEGPEYMVSTHLDYHLPDFISAYDITDSPVWYYPELKKIDTAFVPVRLHLYY
ncbi:MAG: hypothetical protein EAY69_00065 [Cytophagales bacterium]|nr:MAG: hypothetical protein EAY69_00065 [Cytophagales bacterium]